MWVKIASGELVNLSQATRIFVRKKEVIAEFIQINITISKYETEEAAQVGLDSLHGAMKAVKFPFEDVKWEWGS